WRGALVAGIGWTLLQFGGTQLVTHELRHYRTLYGTFASVIVLVWWIGLGTLLTAFAAELDVVVQRRLWPRSFRHGGPSPEAGPPTGAQPSTATGAVA
ncbi:MAG TPA: YhjD/YihY/BrkB family envelope integrity protein, partial [Acidimicrobiales bacterium]